MSMRRKDDYSRGGRKKDAAWSPESLKKLIDTWQKNQDAGKHLKSGRKSNRTTDTPTDSGCLPPCPTCGSQKVRVEASRFQCGDCGYDRELNTTCPKCKGTNIVIRGKTWRCRTCNPKQFSLKSCPVCNSKKLSVNGIYKRCNQCGYTNN